MPHHMNNISAQLAEIIETEGPDILINEPWKAYQMLLNFDTADKKMAAALLHTFIAGVPSFFTHDRKYKHEDISKAVQKQCCLRKNISDKIAEIYLALYSQENIEFWDSSQRCGLKSFMEHKWDIEWFGDAQWDNGQGYVDCAFHAIITIAPIKGRINEPELEKMLSKNAFLSEEIISQYFKDSLLEYLDQNFENYCTYDDYYPPVGEDFEAEDYTEDWCKDHGFELIAFEGKGSTDDYEPRHRKWH